MLGVELRGLRTVLAVSSLVSSCSSEPPTNPAPSGSPTPSSSAAPPNAACVPPAAQGKHAIAARAIQRLSCEPGLFLMPRAELRKELALPPDHELEFVRSNEIVLRFPKGPATELASALGVPSALGRRATRGAWSWRIWTLATDVASGALDVWGPGTVSISLRPTIATVPDDAKSLPLVDLEQQGHAGVTMPESALRIEDDAAALVDLVGALESLARDPQLLSLEPSELAKRVPLDAERFRLSSTSGSRSAVDYRGVDVTATRTRIAAGPLLEALGLAGTIRPSEAHDSDAHVLRDDEKESHAWKGLRLELEFDERPGRGTGGRHGRWILASVPLPP
jgi:hypothetical protein